MGIEEDERIIILAEKIFGLIADEIEKDKRSGLFISSEAIAQIMATLSGRYVNGDTMLLRHIYNIAEHALGVTDSFPDLEGKDMKNWCRAKLNEIISKNI